MSPDPQPETIPLSRVSEGDRVRIERLAGGRGMRSRLQSMGLRVGMVVDVVRRGRGGSAPAIVSAGPVRLMIGRGMIDRVLVTPVADGSDGDEPSQEPAT